jgi:hypothetical protein
LKVCIFASKKIAGMKCNIHVYLLNEHFSQEHADANHKGEESENNQKYEWEDEFAVTSDVFEINVHENASFPLQGELPDGTPFSHDVNNMLLFEICSHDAPVTCVGASSSIVSNWERSDTSETISLRIYLKDYEPMSNPIPGIYIASKEFPKALIF